MTTAIGGRVDPASDPPSSWLQPKGFLKRDRRMHLVGNRSSNRLTRERRRVVEKSLAIGYLFAHDVLLLPPPPHPSPPAQHCSLPWLENRLTTLRQ